MTDPSAGPRPRRVAMVTVHTSPLAQPGTGDAGGMNVYVLEVARQLARLGTEVDIFTRARRARPSADVVEVEPGVVVRHVAAGPYEGLSKEDLPGQLCAFAAGMMRVAAHAPPGHYDLVHSHYWLSGQVGWLAADRWGVPLVHTMHTMARVKNLHLADGDEPEPRGREIGEAQVVEAADRLVANTEREAAELVDLYDADPARVAVVQPGVDLVTFSPGSTGRGPRGRSGCPPTRCSCSSSAASSRSRRPTSSSAPRPSSCGAGPTCATGSSSASSAEPAAPAVRNPMGLEDLAQRLGIGDRRALRAAGRPPDARRLVPRGRRRRGPVAQRVLRARRRRGAGLRHTGRRGERRRPAHRRRDAGGLLVDGHDTADWATALGRVALEPGTRAALSRRASEHAAGLRMGTHGRAAARGLPRGAGPPEGRVHRRRRADRRRPAGGHPVSAADLVALVRDVLDETGLEWEPGARDDEFVVSLPGEKKLRTVVSLVCGENALSVSAFVIRNPDENHGEVYRFLLQPQPAPARPRLRRRPLGRRLRHRTGAGRRGRRRSTSTSCSASCSSAVDEPFNELLVMGFLTSMRKEWEWRVSRGESLRNLEAFRHILERPGDPPRRDRDLTRLAT